MWYADPSAYFTRHGMEATANATEMYNILYGSYGWDFYAVMAVLANTYAESTFNPWLWEGQTVRARSSSSPLYYRNFDGGYGLIQWTPYPSTPHPNTQPYIDSTIAQRYIGYSPNFSDQSGTADDGAAQTNFIVYDMMDNGNWFSASISYYGSAFSAVGVDITAFRTMTKQQFADGTFAPKTAENYVGAFELNYLRPNAYYAAQRFQSMLVEFDYWYQYFSGSPPPPPPPVPTDPNILFYAAKRRRKGGWLPI